ncbi:MAG: hypothetical protein QOH73_197 [Gaiellaceae bacterium]|nr:hypothetical protein [Gaiellaceae bacterium]
MKRFFADMNPTVRGFLISAAIVAAIVAFRPAAITFGIVWLLAQILFLIAIGYLIYRWWREHRGEIALWPGRAKWGFYAAAAVIAVELFIAYAPIGANLSGLPFLAWILGIAICAYAMWRIWRDEHTYGY